MREAMTREELDVRIRDMVDSNILGGLFDASLYHQYDIKRGLRDSHGRGVRTGLTEISDVVGTQITNVGRKVPGPGHLYYQGVDVNDLIDGCKDRRFCFEETIYLLLMGQLPTEKQLVEFAEILQEYRELPDTFVRDVIMKATPTNMMNALQRCVLTLYSYDKDPDNTDLFNVFFQTIHLIAKMPSIAVYSYRAHRHYNENQDLIIRNPKPGLSMAENLLQMLRRDGSYTELEARVLDVALVLHAEHGGGNNSTFTTHVVTSTDTDTYSAVAASLGSLKGPRHGGANLKVREMFADIKEHVKDWEDEEELKAYLMKILDHEAFDGAGLIYGMGHAVYTVSDPRAVILKHYAEQLSKEKGREKEFNFLASIERVAAGCIQQKRTMFKPVCANVDLYSGLVYNMLEIPRELYTPIFAIARLAGWSAHRIEEINNKGKIIRPAYVYVGHHRDYVPLHER